MIECPCKKDCPKRTPICHSLCSEYLEWRAELDEINKQKTEDWAMGYVIKKMEKKRKIINDKKRNR